MRKYLLVILFLSIGFGQDVLTLKKGAIYEGKFLGVKSGKVHFQPTNVSVFKPRRLNEIRELTQNGQTLIENGKLYVVKNGESEGEYEGGIKFGAVLVAASGALGLYMNNLEFDSVNEWYDYMENDAKALNNARFGLLLFGGILLLFD